MKPYKPARPEDIEVGHVYRYHPITTRMDVVMVNVVSEPWQLDDGSWICKAVRVDNGATVRPWVGALEAQEGES